MTECCWPHYLGTNRNDHQTLEDSTRKYFNEFRICSQVILSLTLVFIISHCNMQSGWFTLKRQTNLNSSSIFNATNKNWLTPLQETEMDLWLQLGVPGLKHYQRAWLGSLLCYWSHPLLQRLCFLQVARHTASSGNKEAFFYLCPHNLLRTEVILAVGMSQLPPLDGYDILWSILAISLELHKWKAWKLLKSWDVKQSLLIDIHYTLTLGKSFNLVKAWFTHR